MELIEKNSNYYGYPKNKMWYAVEFSLHNPTSSPYSIDLFNGYNFTPIPNETPLYDTPIQLDATISTSVVANQQGAYCSANNCLYVGNDSGLFTRVDVVDCSTNTIIKTFNATEVTIRPTQMVYNSFNNQIYISSSSSASVVRIDCSSNTVIGSPIVLSAFGNNSMAYNSTSNAVYVGVSNGVDVINCGTNLVTTTISLPSSYDFTFVNNCLCYNPSLDRIYAYVFDVSLGSKVFIIDCQSNNIINSILVSATISAATMLYNQNNNNLYLADGDLNIYSINCSNNVLTNIFTFPASDYQNGLALNLFNNVVYGYSILYGGYYYIDCLDNSIHGFTPPLVTSNVPSFGVYNTINNTMYLTNIISNEVILLRNTANFYITGSNDYNQFVRELQNIPKRVRHIRLTVESYSQMAVPFYLLKRDANGNFCGVPRIPTEDLRPEDYQSFMCEMAFNPKELILNNNEIISGYTVAPESTVKMVIYFDEIDMSDLLSEKLNVYNQIETKVEDLNTISEQTLEIRYEDRPTIKPSWLKNFKGGKTIKI